jgi:hypothetical protein
MKEADRCLRAIQENPEARLAAQNSWESVPRLDPAAGQRHHRNAIETCPGGNGDQAAKPPWTRSYGLMWRGVLLDAFGRRPPAAGEVQA